MTSSSSITSCLLFNFEPPAVSFNSPAGCTSIQRQTSVRVGPLGRLKDHLSCNEEVVGCDLLRGRTGDRVRLLRRLLFACNRFPTLLQVGVNAPQKRLRSSRRVWKRMNQHANLRAGHFQNQNGGERRALLQVRPMRASGGNTFFFTIDEPSLEIDRTNHSDIR